MEFNEWLNEKFFLWQDKDREKTVTKFAEWIGIPQSQMSEYMKPKSKKPVVPKTPRIFDLFYYRFGEEIYDVLPPPDDGLDVLLPDLARRIRVARSETVKVLKDKGISITSPEGKETMINTFSEFGIALNEKE